MSGYDCRSGFSRGRMNEAPVNVTWFVSHLTGEPGSYDSVIASVRLRCLIPAMELESSHGMRVSLVHLTPDVRIPDSIFRDTDVAVFGKIFHDWLPLYRELQKNSVPIVVDVCDDVFSLPHLRKNYENLFPCADSVVASSVYLANLLKDRLDITPVVVHDAVEGERRDPKVLWCGDTQRLAWFGQPMNLPPLLNQLGELSELDMTLELDIVTRMNSHIRARLETEQKRHARIELYLQEWSASCQRRVLEGCDIVVIPSSDKDQFKAKSPNRLVAALWAGKPVVAYPLPAYREFAEYVTLDTSTARGVERLLRSPAARENDCIRNGQVHIDRQYGIAAIASGWWSVLNDVFGGRNVRKNAFNIEAPIRAGQEKAIRLNLGCGDKLLEGYINVDLADNRHAKPPDVISDIRDLSAFPDNYADEILSVHVIEHFYYWEVPGILREWVRILQPGGVLVLETPDLLNACREILDNPETATDPGPAGRMGIWPLYGDPGWKDPLMCHRWLYTPESLGRLLSQCGLVEISRESAKYKMREPRDMRMVGRKPDPPVKTAPKS